jgi:hypothetical protein
MKADHNGHGGGQGSLKVSPQVAREQSIAAHHEVSDVELRGIIVFLTGLTVMTVVVYLLMILMFNLLNTREDASDRKPAQLAAEKEHLPPEPRLQSAPGFAEQLEKEVGIKEGSEKDRPKDRTWELDQLQLKWEDDLKHGPKDQNGQPSGISIEQAKQQILSGSGLPTRAATTPQTGADGPAAYAIEMPTAASSGRVTEKRKQ